MNRRLFLFLFISTIFVLFSCGQKKLETKDLEIKKTSGQVVLVNAELAKTEEEQMYGFMNRKNIPDGTGMLFIFKDDRIASFWMKNTPTPLSIAYIDYSPRLCHCQLLGATDRAAHLPDRPNSPPPSNSSSDRSTLRGKFHGELRCRIRRCG